MKLEGSDVFGTFALFFAWCAGISFSEGHGIAFIGSAGFAFLALGSAFAAHTRENRRAKR